MVGPRSSDARTRSPSGTVGSENRLRRHCYIASRAATASIRRQPQTRATSERLLFRASFFCSFIYEAGRGGKRGAGMAIASAIDRNTKGGKGGNVEVGEFSSQHFSLLKNGTVVLACVVW